MSIVDLASQNVGVDGKFWNRQCAPAPAQPATDEVLLRRFLADRDEMALAQIVSRHASLVMGVCRRTLGNEQDAEDAFQATFLVLVRKAASVRRGASLSAWLYQTAYRISLRARAKRARRKEQSLEVEIMTTPDTFPSISDEYQQSALDEELNRLPDKYRIPLVMCCLEGKSREKAAEQLGLTPGAIKGRLERGRQVLRRKLMLRGISLTVVLSILSRVQHTAYGASTVAPSLIMKTAQAGAGYAAGNSANGLVTQNALYLANRSFQMMSITSTTKITACCMLMMGTLTLLSHFVPASAYAEAGLGETISLAAHTAGPDFPDTSFVAFHSADEREGQQRSPEAEAGPRRSPEAEAGPRRSAEAEAGPRRSPEAEAGPRRSPEAEAGPRRSPEAEAGPRRSAERDRGPERSAEGQRGRQTENPLQGFRPQTRREAALFQMILQLQRQVDMIQKELDSRKGEGISDSDTRAESRDRDVPALDAGWERTKEGGIFRAYDKNGDQFVALEEWLAMTNGNISPARREQQTKRFFETRPGSDAKLSPAEFIYWWNHREGARSSSQDRETGRSAEGETRRRSPEAGEREREN